MKSVVLVSCLACLVGAWSLAAAQPAPPAAAESREAFLEQRVTDELAADGILLARLGVTLDLTAVGDALQITLIDQATGQPAASSRLAPVPADREAAVATLTPVVANLAARVTATRPPVTAPPATAAAAPGPVRRARRVAALEGGMTSSDFFAVGAAVYPIPGLAIEGWMGPTELWGTVGGAVAYTHGVADWTQRSSSLWRGVAGVGQLRVGGGVGVKTFSSCVFFCVDGDAVDAFVRVEAIKFFSPHVGGQMVLDAGGSVIDADDGGGAALYPFVGFRIGLVLGL
ncbi:MAG: hypothetical protein IPL61_39455 [Myxococcales bacterium]|nr:hypothetical protein [Myxococcales bacterium]